MCVAGRTANESLHSTVGKKTQNGNVELYTTFQKILSITFQPSRRLSALRERKHSSTPKPVILKAHFRKKWGTLILDCFLIYFTWLLKSPHSMIALDKRWWLTDCGIFTLGIAIGCSPNMVIKILPASWSRYATLDTKFNCLLNICLTPIRVRLLPQQ